MSKIIEKIKSFIKANSEIITPTAVLAIICVVVTLALSSANLLTHKRIAALAKDTQEKAMAKVMPGEYEEITETVADDEITYHIVRKDGSIIGYIFTTAAKGYGGEISVMTAVKTDLTVAAVEILDASGETPGLGQNVTNSEWFAQFAGLKDGINVVKGSADSTNNQINAVTGATVSSKAVTAAVNQALDYATEIITKGDKS